MRVRRVAGQGERGATPSGPREKLIFWGERACTDEELLAIILGCGVAGRPVAEVAASLLREVGGLGPLGESSVPDLAAIKGIGTARAARVAAALELARRAVCQPSPMRRQVRSGAQVDQLYRARLAGLGKERFVVLLLDIRNRIFREETVAEGTLVSAPIDPREVFLPAVRHRAASILAVHNHPSGDPSPSPEDHEVTRRLKLAGEILGIPLLDHVVIAREGFTSLLESGWL